MVPTYRILFLIFLENLFDPRKCIEAGLQKVLANLDQNGITPGEISVERNRISNLFYKMRSKWNDVKRIKEKFEEKYKGWLDTQFVLPAKFYTSSVKPGPKELDFNDKGERSKRRATQKLREEYSTDVLLHATLSSLHTSTEPWHQDLHHVLKQCMDDHTKAQKYKKASSLVNSLKTVPRKDLALPQPLNANDSLIYLYDADHTKQSYQLTRDILKEQKADILVPYAETTSEKKKLRPENMSFTEHEANVPLSDLLLHTNKRILEATECHKSATVSGCSSEPIVIEADYKGGWDSATGQSVYKQKFESEESKGKFVAESLLTTSIVPLRFRCNGKTIWENPVPQGANFCRPLRLAFEKENHETASAIKQDLESQVAKVGDQKIQHDGCLMIFRLIFHLCMLDGKARNVANDHRSSQSCSICKAKPNDFNSPSNFTSWKFEENLDCLKHGISPLHTG